MTTTDERIILVLPGGGYQAHAPHEAEPIAEWVESLGWRSRIVRYPVDTRHPGPLEHVRRAVSDARAAGAVTVGVIGFSAGGHLAGHALLDPGSTDDERPDFAVLGYPVVSMSTAVPTGSELRLLGPDAPAALRGSASLERLVTPDSRPMFIWHTTHDSSVPVEQHSYPLGIALASAGVPHELHVFPGDIHGIGLGEGTAAEPWTRLCAAWLARL